MQDVKLPSEEDQKILDECKKQWLHAFRNDAMTVELMKDMFGIGTDGILHAAIFVKFGSPQEACKCFSKLADSANRTLQLGVKHFKKAFTKVTGAVKFIGTERVRDLLPVFPGPNCETFRISLTNALAQKEGGVAWLFEIQYNSDGDCRYESCVTVKQLVKGTFAEDIKKTLPPKAAEAVINHLKNVEIPADFKMDLAIAKQLVENVKTAPCRTCKKTVDKMMRCASCKSARYCSKVCQTKHWKAEHKEWCKFEHVLIMDLVHHA